MRWRSWWGAFRDGNITHDRRGEMHFLGRRCNIRTMLRGVFCKCAQRCHGLRAHICQRRVKITPIVNARSGNRTPLAGGCDARPINKFRWRGWRKGWSCCIALVDTVNFSQWFRRCRFPAFADGLRYLGGPPFRIAYLFVELCNGQYKR